MKEKRNYKPLMAYQIVFYGIIVTVFMFLVYLSGNLSREVDSQKILAWKALSPAVYSLDILGDAIFTYIKHHQWIYFVVPLSVLVFFMFFNTGRGVDRIVSGILLASPFLFCLSDTHPGFDPWKYSWVSGMLLVISGYIFQAFHPEGCKLEENFRALEKKTIIILIMLIVAGYFFRTIWVNAVPPRFDDDALYDMHQLVLDVFENGKNPLSYFVIPRRFYTCDESFYMALTGYAFKKWGISLLSVRLVTALVGVLTVFLMYLVFSELFSRRFALAAAGMLSIFPFHISYSRYGHTFHFPIVLMLACSYFMIKAVKKSSGRYAFLSGICMGFAPLFHLSAMASIPFVFTLLWLDMPLRSRSRNLARLTLWLVVGGLIGATPFLLNIHKHKYQFITSKKVRAENGVTGDGVQSGIAKNFEKFKRFFLWEKAGSFLRGGTHYFLRTSHVPVLYAMFLGLAFWGLGISLRAFFSDRGMRYLVLLLFWTPIPALLSLPLPKRMTSLVIPVTGFVIVACCKGITHVKKGYHGLQRGIFSTFLIFMAFLFGVNAVSVVFRPDKPPWREFLYPYVFTIKDIVDAGGCILANVDHSVPNCVRLFIEQDVRNMGQRPEDFFERFRMGYLKERVADIVGTQGTIYLMLQTSRRYARNESAVDLIMYYFPGCETWFWKDYCILRLNIRSTMDLEKLEIIDELAL